MASLRVTTLTVEVDLWPPNDNRHAGLLARLRISVLYTLEAIAQHFLKSITSSMGLYLPEQTTPYMTLFNNTPSVLTLLIADPSEKARITAAKFLNVFWDKIPLKMYFRPLVQRL
ncbi:hypothetical protein P3T76_000132 [Phytophthora citrophthora]|uniref:Uncharacterized protein n=1 Tax=Phytophthora citrophthora TaxID=4793 RepID=A0AAD9LUZ3_9STRA|nr:hypothetical protein P3T76_000132 [Phytophthora citrophthora]